MPTLLVAGGGYRYISLERLIEDNKDRYHEYYMIRLLRDLKAAQRVERLGRGPGAKWRKR